MRSNGYRFALMVGMFVGGLAVLAVAFVIALEVRSVVAGPEASPGGPVPNPGHAWNSIQDHGTDGVTGDYWLGTTEPHALELRVNGARALRLEPNGISPSVIGGYSGNGVTVGVAGATIPGGGSPGLTNRVTDDYGTVGGGHDNIAGDGQGSTFDSGAATVGGGQTNAANNVYASVGGGVGNTAGGMSSTVGGGDSNAASANHAAIGGGLANRVTDDVGTVAGGQNNLAGDDAGTADDARYATVGGGNSNSAGGIQSTVGGGYSNDAGGDDATVGGGHDNAGSGDSATIAGGWTNTASGNASTVGGGNTNTASNQSATVGGGANNVAGGDQATVGGGGGNAASGVSATVGGGDANTAGGGSNATVGGGHGNTASGSDATVGGGNTNSASADGAAVCGGTDNIASAPDTTIGGGSGNRANQNWDTVGGGEGNTASGWNSTVGGGYQNAASGLNATVPGGASNTAAGAWSFAVGRNSKANNQGCFVWGDVSAEADVQCNDDNRFVARAGGGVYLYTTGDLSTGAYLASGSGSWSDLSDRNLKENFTSVDGREVLASLAEIPVTTWNYKAQDDSVRHMGPAAQDFSAAFGLGESDTAVSTIDADGVALAAIQGLYSLVQEQGAQIAAQQQRIEALEQADGVNDGSAGPLSSAAPAGWLFLGGLLVVGVVLFQRRRAAGWP